MGLDHNVQLGLFTYLSDQSSDPVPCFVSTFGDNSPGHEFKSPFEASDGGGTHSGLRE